MEKIFLFSVDLEDVRLGIPYGLQYKDRLAANTIAYLNWLRKHTFKCTFFTVGNVAEKYPSLINEITSEGHEIASHTLSHIPLDQHTPETFKADLSQNIELLLKAGAKSVTGFRAPTFSLTEKTKWAYRILKELNLTYSSSVLPADNPLYGWKNFGSQPRKTDEGILEIPMTVGNFGPLVIPYGGGVYFRILPEFLISLKTKTHTSVQNPLLGYFHPYDIDTEQEHFMHPGLNNSKVYNYLMYYNRHKVYNRLETLVKQGFSIMTYSEYVGKHLSI